MYIGDLLVLGTPEALKAMISGVSQAGEVFGNRALEEGRWNLAHDTGQLHQGSPQTKPWRRNIFLAHQEIPLAKLLLSPSWRHHKVPIAGGFFGEVCLALFSCDIFTWFRVQANDN